MSTNHVSLADLYLFAIVAYLMMTPEKALAWWVAVNQRFSVKNTRPNF